MNLRTRIATLVLLCLCFSWCWAQPNVINRRAMAIAGLATSAPFTPNSINGIQYYWDCRDIIGTNVAITNWDDRIQGNRLTNAVYSTTATNTATGVFIANGTSLTNVSGWSNMLAAVMTCTAFWTVKQTTPNTTISFVAQTKGLAGKQQNLFHWAGGADPWSRWTGLENGGNIFSLLAVNGEDIETNQWVTIARITQSNSVSSATVSTYTNGVFCKSFTFGSSQAQPEGMSVIGNNSRTGQGYISQMIYYTNVLTASQISNLNYFAYKP